MLLVELRDKIVELVDFDVKTILTNILFQLHELLTANNTVGNDYYHFIHISGDSATKNNLGRIFSLENLLSEIIQIIWIHDGHMRAERDDISIA